MYNIAIDIGGTFTDVVVIENESGQLYMGKSLTTPEDLQQGVLDVLSNISTEVGISIKELLSKASRIVHATTQSSNAIFAYSGAKTAVLTTRGFGDTLIIMRATGRVAGLSVYQRHHYSATSKPRFVVDERDIFEVPERVDSRGIVVAELNEDAVRDIARTLRVQEYEAVAISYLFSHQNPQHEKRTAEIILEEIPEIYISNSADVSPIMGEYERSASALFNSYVGPIIESYLDRLEKTLIEKGLKQRLFVVQANGGLSTVAQTVPIFTIESGPAAGVVGAAYVAKKLGFPRVVATDVGGTTFKVAIIDKGNWSYRKDIVLNQYQLRIPAIDVQSIGAGGGSIAWADGSRLRVGPQSAEADPGPACYNLGGNEPTVTDADVVLGYISPEQFLGGRMRLDADRSVKSIKEKIADPLFNGDIIDAAAGIKKVINSQMADLIRKSTLERGHDPRNFVMMAYGGSGPAHVASYGYDVGVSSIVIPYFATVLSAYGAALSDIRFSFQFSEPIVLPCDSARIEQIFTKMEVKGAEALENANVPEELREYQRWVEAKYRRQVHNLRVTANYVDNAGLDQIALDFTNEYERLFGPGSGLKDAGIELVNFGVDAVGQVEKAPWEKGVGNNVSSPYINRPTYCFQEHKMVSTPVYEGPNISVGTLIEGPAIIEHPGTTIVLHIGQTLKIDEFRHSHINTGISKVGGTNV